jgi:hypothetical protein
MINIRTLSSAGRLKALQRTATLISFDVLWLGKAWEPNPASKLGGHSSDMSQQSIVGNHLQIGTVELTHLDPSTQGSVSSLNMFNGIVEISCSPIQIF